MSDKQKTIVLDLDGKPITLTVKRATAVIGVRRYQMMIQAEKDNETEQDEAAKPLRLFTYPDVIAGTVDQQGFDIWPIPFKDFAVLDEDFVNLWTAAVHEVNPHWRGRSDPEEDKKKL